MYAVPITHFVHSNTQLVRRTYSVSVAWKSRNSLHHPTYQSTMCMGSTQVPNVRFVDCVFLTLQPCVRRTCLYMDFSARTKEDPAHGGRPQEKRTVLRRLSSLQMESLLATGTYWERTCTRHYPVQGKEDAGEQYLFSDATADIYRSVPLDGRIAGISNAVINK